MSLPAARNRHGRNGQIRALVIAFGVGSLFAVGLGVYGSTHEPTFFALNVAGFSSGIAAKAWLATGAFVLAVVQLVSALIMYGRIPVRAPSWIGALHRWSGRVCESRMREVQHPSEVAGRRPGPHVMGDPWLSTTTT